MFYRTVKHLNDCDLWGFSNVFSLNTHRRMIHIKTCFGKIVSGVSYGTPVETLSSGNRSEAYDQLGLLGKRITMEITRQADGNSSQMSVTTTDKAVSHIHSNSLNLRRHVSEMLAKSVCITSDVERACRDHEKDKEKLERLVREKREDVAEEKEQLRRINEKVEQARKDLEAANKALAILGTTAAVSVVGAIVTAPTIIGPLLFGAGAVASAVGAGVAADDSDKARSRSREHKQEASEQASEVEEAKRKYEHAQRERDENERNLKEKKRRYEAWQQEVKVTSQLDPKFKTIHHLISRLKSEFEIVLFSLEDCSPAEERKMLENIIHVTNDLGMKIKENLANLPEYTPRQSDSLIAKFSADYKDRVSLLKRNVTSLTETVGSLQPSIVGGSR